MVLHHILWPLEARTKSVPTLWPPTSLLHPRSVPGLHLMKVECQSLTSLNRTIRRKWAHMIAWMAAFIIHLVQARWSRTRSDQNPSALKCFRAVKERRSYLAERKACQPFPTQFPIQIFWIQQAVVTRQMRRRENNQGGNPVLLGDWKVEPAVEGIVGRYSYCFSTYLYLMYVVVGNIVTVVDM